jgi:hypothetical protein
MKEWVWGGGRVDERNKLNDVRAFIARNNKTKQTNVTRKIKKLKHLPRTNSIP